MNRDWDKVRRESRSWASLSPSQVADAHYRSRRKRWNRSWQALRQDRLNRRQAHRRDSILLATGETRSPRSETAPPPGPATARSYISPAAPLA